MPDRFLRARDFLLAHRTDAALYCNGANAIFTLWPRLLGVPVALNVDGIERRRKKWNRLARGWYLLSEWLTGLFPTVVIADARTIQDYYHEHYRKQSIFIPYGAAAGKVAGVLIDSSGGGPDRFLVGTGVNVNRTRFPPELEHEATSLALATGHVVASVVALEQ